LYGRRGGSGRLPDASRATSAYCVFRARAATGMPAGGLHAAHCFIPPAILLSFAGKADSVISTSKAAPAAPVLEERSSSGIVDLYAAVSVKALSAAAICCGAFGISRSETTCVPRMDRPLAKVPMLSSGMELLLIPPTNRKLRKDHVLWCCVRTATRGRPPFDEARGPISSIGGVLADDSLNKPVPIVLLPEPATGRPFNGSAGLSLRGRPRRAESTASASATVQFVWNGERWLCQG